MVQEDVRLALELLLKNHEDEKQIYEEMSNKVKESDPDLSRDLHMMIHHSDIASRFLKGSLQRYLDDQAKT